MPGELVPKEPIPFHNDGRVMFVHFLNNYDGDCTLVEIPEGDGTYKNLLIDMGHGQEGEDPKPGGIDALKFFMENFLSPSNRRIHLAIISHWHDDHYNDFDKLLADDQISPESVWVPNYLPDKKLSSGAWNLIQEFRDKFIFTQEHPDPIIISNDERVRVVVVGPRSQYVNKTGSGRKSHPIYVDPTFTKTSDEPVEGWKIFLTASAGSTINNYSLIVRLEFCRKAALFPGDVEDAGWKNIVPEKYGTEAWISSAKEVFRCDLLKISHHGKEKLALPFRPLPQYAVCTRFTKEERKISAEGRDMRNDIEWQVRRSGDPNPELVEEVFHVGGDQMVSRIVCSFAFVPNKDGDDAIIVPIIYKRAENREKESEIYYFIRPAERDCM